MKITLDSIVSGFKSVTKLITNFDKIEDDLNNKVLYRDNPEGEPNYMQNDLDMNSYNILNQGNPVEVSGFNWLGDWSSLTTYAAGDAVHSNGTAYIAIAASTNQTPPNGTYWQIVAEANYPTQTGNADKALTTDGSAASWGSIHADHVDFTNSGTGGVERTLQAKLEDVVNVKDFGAVGDGATDDTAAIQAALDFLTSGDSLHLGSSSDIFLFTTLTLPTETVFEGSGTLRGITSGSKPTEAALISAGSAAAREALLDAYYTSSVSTGATCVVKGSLFLENCVIKGTSSLFSVAGDVTLSDVGFYGICLSATTGGNVTSDSGALLVDSPADGVFFLNSGSMTLPDCSVLYAALRGIHFQFGGELRAAGGSSRFNGGEGVFLNAGGLVDLTNGFASDNSDAGILAIYGGRANVGGVTVNNNGQAGIVCESNSSVYAVGSTITGNTNTGIDSSYDGVVQAASSTITGNGQQAVRIRTGGVVNVETATIDRTNNSGAAPILWVQGRGVIYSESSTGSGKTALNDDDFKPVHNEMNGLAWIGEWAEPDDTGKRSRYYAYSNQNSAQTIAAGVITASNGWLGVDTEALAASDDLDTINGGQNLQRLILTATNSTRTVVVKHGTGNIHLNGGVDFSLDHQRDTIELIQQYGVWVELSRSTNA